MKKMLLKAVRKKDLIKISKRRPTPVTVISATLRITVALILKKTSGAVSFTINSP